MERIYITGSGRCGTTFLIKLFSFLNYDTGYTRENYEKSILKNCNSGMEKQHNDCNYIIKNPTIMENIEAIINDKTIKIKTIIIPIRDFKSSAISRVNHGKYAGGLWNATDEESQIQFYNKIMANYIYFMTKHELNTIFIDFDKMISNTQYLFEKLKPILDEKNVDFELFQIVYDEVSITSAPKK